MLSDKLWLLLVCIFCLLQDANMKDAKTLGRYILQNIPSQSDTLLHVPTCTHVL
jgi:hypothetical protein